MDEVTLHDGFVPLGSSSAPVPAVSLGAGCIWLDAYRAVTTHGGRYVQGGGCTTVGVGGFVQGGGFGSFSKAFGTGAAHLLEAEIVTADGRVRIVNAVREPDLFWALRGGGGGTFGVVTRLTLRTHDLPRRFGVVHWTLRAISDAAFRRLLDRFVALYADHLFNPHWGEQASARPGNVLEVTMLFQGLDAAQAQAAWQGLITFVAAHPREYVAGDDLLIADIPARHFWDEAYMSQVLPSAVARDTREGAGRDNWWWKGDSQQVAAFWHGYESAWLPQRLLHGENRAAFVDAWFSASRRWPVTLHFNKGLAGGSASAIDTSGATAMNAKVLDAFALAIIACDGPTAYLGLSETDLATARRNRSHIRQAMQALRNVIPDAGCYMSECDYNLPDWQRAFWGDNAQRLQQVKKRYDPTGLFMIHHGVGSDGWSADGFTRTG